MPGAYNGMRGLSLIFFTFPREKNLTLRLTLPEIILVRHLPCFYFSMCYGHRFRNIPAISGGGSHSGEMSMSVTMQSRRLRTLFTAGAVMTMLFFAAVTVIFVDSYRDPRWRAFDLNSRQATAGDIYNVAEIPAIRKVKLVGERRLAFSFTPPIDTENWTIRSLNDSSVVHTGKRPEIPFSGEPHTDTYRFEPDGVTLLKNIDVTVSFYPGERYADAGLSWPDNYYSPYASVPFSLKRPRSIDDWAGLSDDDPDAIEARRILEGNIDMDAPSSVRAEQVFRFVMDAVSTAGGTPTDEVQDASPLETYRMLTSERERAFARTVRSSTISSPTPRV